MTDLSRFAVGHTVYGAEDHQVSYGQPYIVVDVHPEINRLRVRPAGESRTLWVHPGQAATEDEWALVKATKGIS